MAVRTAAEARLRLFSGFVEDSVGVLRPVFRNGVAGADAHERKWTGWAAPPQSGRSTFSKPRRLTMNRKVVAGELVGHCLVEMGMGTGRGWVLAPSGGCAGGARGYRGDEMGAGQDR
jgi:hypothetical protein